MTKPLSKAAQVRQADKILRGLLRTPKSRAGLVAAVTTKTISRNYVFGWLAESRRDGTITTHKSGATLMYQVATQLVSEVAQASIYPSWLDPRSLPTAIDRMVVVDGVRIKTKGTAK